MIEFFYSSHMLARHVSDFTGPSSGAFLQAVCTDLVCGNTRTTRHVQPLRSNGWTCRVVRVYFVGLHIYYMMISGPYNIKLTLMFFTVSIKEILGTGPWQKQQ